MKAKDKSHTPLFLVFTLFLEIFEFFYILIGIINIFKIKINHYLYLYLIMFFGLPLVLIISLNKENSLYINIIFFTW